MKEKKGGLKKTREDIEGVACRPVYHVQKVKFKFFSFLDKRQLLQYTIAFIHSYGRGNIDPRKLLHARGS